MCCCGGWWSVIRALFLVADMGSDCLNVWDYHNKAYEKNENRTNFFSSKFYKNWNGSTREYDGVLESYYFIISFSAMLLPMVIATICLLFYLLYVYFMEIRQFFIRRCCSAECGKVFGTIASSLMAPLTFILCVIFSILVIVLSWIVSPLLHIFFAFFLAFGNKPAGKDESKMKSLMWKRFATLMMFLSIVETLFEAVPQAILGLCLSSYQLKHSSIEDNESRLLHLWEIYPFQVVSLFFSFCSVVKTLGHVAYTTTHDWDNSIFGMVNFLKNQYKEKHQKAKTEMDLKREKEEEIEMLNDKIKHLETLNDVKQKALDFHNRFNADLEISGFETGEDGMKRGRFLNDMGIPTELLFDKDKASFPDKSCVLTELGLPESLRYMNKLHGKKYNVCDLNLNCSIYIGESKIPSTPNSPGIMPLPIIEEVTDLENTQLLNGDIKEKEPKKEKKRFPFWRSKTASKLDHSDLELQDKTNESDVENTQLLNGDLQKKSRFPFWRSKTVPQLDHSENKNDVEVQNTDAKNNEETSDTPPPSCPSTPTLLPETESQISDTESTQEILKENSCPKTNLLQTEE